MRILLYGINYAPEMIGIGKYSTEMAQRFLAAGHEVRVVTGMPYYPQWNVKDPYKSWRYMVESIEGVTVYRSPLYVPQKLGTVSRLLHLMSFSLSSLLQLGRQIRWRPDVVLVVAPTMFCVPGALLLTKIVGARSWLHIQDFEVVAWANLLGSGGFPRLTRFAEKVEGVLLRAFDTVTTISRSMRQRLERLRVPDEKLAIIPNWVDVEFISPDADADHYRQLWQYRPSDKIVLYSGNIGGKQGLGVIVEAAESFKHVDDVQFVLVGDGSNRERLERECAARALNNVRFFSLQPYEDLPKLMCLADLHVVPQRRGVGNALFPSKLATILAAGGTCLVAAESDSELAHIVNDGAGLGYVVEPEQTTTFIETLGEALQKVDVNNRRHNTAARIYAEENFSRKAVLDRMEDHLSTVTATPRPLRLPITPRNSQ